ncbi:MAG: hypothetical protein E7Z97_08515 [Propionibacteriaceae bacterium]|nr:hypothetical protein [Propionibacteriaceae bacterium]
MNIAKLQHTVPSHPVNRELRGYLACGVHAAKAGDWVGVQDVFIELGRGNTEMLPDDHTACGHGRHALRSDVLERLVQAEAP